MSLLWREPGELVVFGCSGGAGREIGRRRAPATYPIGPDGPRFDHNEAHNFQFHGGTGELGSQFHVDHGCAIQDSGEIQEPLEPLSVPTDLRFVFELGRGHAKDPESASELALFVQQRRSRAFEDSGFRPDLPEEIGAFLPGGAPETFQIFPKGPGGIEGGQ